MFTRPNASRRSRVAHTLLASLVFVGCGTESLGPRSSDGLDSILDGELELFPSELLMMDASSEAFTVRLVRPNGTIVTHLGSGTAIEWNSTAPGIASVSSSGLVTAKLPGSAEIEARFGDRIARAPVIVLPEPTEIRPLFDGEMSGTAGAPLADSVAVRIVDRGGLPVSGVEVTFSVELGSGTVSPLKAVTDGAGVAKSQWRLGDDAGDNALRASAAGLDDVLLRARGESGGTDHRLELTGGNSQTGVVAEKLPQDLRVRVTNAAGTPQANVPVVWVFDDGGVDIEGGGGVGAQAQMTANTDGTGVSRVRWRLGERAGTNRARARLANGVELWFQAQAAPAEASALSVEPGAASLGVGGRMSLRTASRDRFGNDATAFGVQWSSTTPSVASVDAGGTVTAVSVGQAVITATVGSLSASSTVNVAATGASSIRIASGNGQSATAGSSLPQQLAAQVTGQGGVPLSGVVVAWSVTSGGGSVSAATSTTDGAGVARTTLTTGVQAGVNQVRATTSGLPAATFTATGVAGPAAAAHVTPGATVLGVGTTRQLQANLADVHGNGVSGASFSWSSANPGVATVDANGQVTGVSEGATTITALSGSHIGTASVTVSAAATRVTLDFTSGTVNAIGDTLRFTARAFDAQGTEIPGAAITWSTLSPGVASVDQLGRVVSKTVGVAMVTVSLGCCQSDTAFLDSRQVLADVSVFPAAPALSIGESVQLQANPADSNGVAMSGVDIEWSSSAPGIASVSSNGVLNGVSSGSTVVNVVAEPAGTNPGMVPKHDAVSVSVSGGSNPPPPPPPPPPPGGPPTGGAVAELPRAYVDTSEPTTTRDIHVAANGNLQSVINSAQRGDRILLAPGAVYGSIQLPQKSGSGWIVIQTDVSLPSGRMTPAIASSLNLATLEDGTANTPVIRATGDVSFYRIQGVQVRAASGVTDLSEMVAINTDRSVTSSMVQPSNIILDRMHIYGNPPALQLKRCVGLNGQNVAVTNSSLIGCSKLGQDSQAILTLDGLGPTAIVNNYLQGGSEIFMSGGGDPHIAGVVPADFEIRNNYFHRPPSWKSGQIGVVKNLLELKNAQRVLIEGNVLEGNWAHGQSGWSILIKSTNQDGGCYWCTSDDITIRWNLLDDGESGLQVVWGNSIGAPHQETERVVVENNVFARLGRAGNNHGWGSPIRISQMPGDVTIRSNTFENPGANHFTMIEGVGGPGTNVSVDSNIGWAGLYGVWMGDGASYPSNTVSGNSIIGGTGAYCSVNHCISSAQMQTVTLAGRSYSLPVVSGRGANLTELAQRLQSVR